MTAAPERPGDPERIAPVRTRPGAVAGGARVIELPRVTDPRGNLSFVESERHIPFTIERVFYLYDIPGGESRSGHAQRHLEQFVVAASGSFRVTLDDGDSRTEHYLNRSYYGIYIPPMVWREIDDFSSGSVCVVLASRAFDESEYIRDYDAFVRELRG